MTKQIAAHVFSSTNTFIKVWPAFSFSGFVKEINGGLGECVIDLPKAFDYDGNDVTLGNHVELRVSDTDTASLPQGAKVVYRGYISLIEREFLGERSLLRVHLLGYYTRLALDVLKSGSNTTLFSATTGLSTSSGSLDDLDIGSLVRAVADRWIAESGDARMHYNTASVPSVGTNATYIFERMTYRDALEKLRAMAPAGTFYYVNADGLLSFGPKPTVPTHRFTFGRHFTSVRLQQSLEKVRNVYLSWNGKQSPGDVYKGYEDSPSIGSYGRRAAVQDNYGITDTATADLTGAQFLQNSRLPDVSVEVEIIDSNADARGYDIESIEPGHTCSLYGFSAGAGALFTDNMLISRVQYFPDRVVLTVEISKSGLVDIQERQGRKIDEVSSGGLQVPTSYT
jgi:hypothetical protein